MPYHHGNLREALVEAGVDLAAKEGIDAVTLRAVSRQVGVSHNAAYRHFADHDALVDAVAARALTRWSEHMEERIGVVRGRSKRAAWDRLEAAGRAYVEFAVTSPGLFQLATAHKLGAVQPEGDVPHCYLQLTACLDELLAVGAISRARRAHAEIACWSCVHGFALLVSDGPLREAPVAEREAGLDAVMRMVREGL